MAALDPAVAAIRTAVRRALSSAPFGTSRDPIRKGLAGAAGDPLTPSNTRSAGSVSGCDLVVACSGGADSLALAAAASFVASRLGLRAGLVTVDHQLQAGSGERAGSVAEWARGEGFEPVAARTVDPIRRRGGPEAAARDARYEALVREARAYGARAVLLGHTMQDQAETVLLALVRGAGLRGLAGMPAERDVDGVSLVRPLLGISRSQTRAACAALGLQAWEDPHNTDPTYTRSRARTLLQALVESLGPAVVVNLAQTARLAGEDAAVLDEMAENVHATVADTDGSLRVRELAALPAAVRTRVLHGWARSLGVPGSALSHKHVDALDALIVNWHGQGPVHLPGPARAPGRLAVTRRGDRLTSA